MRERSGLKGNWETYEPSLVSLVALALRRARNRSSLKRASLFRTCVYFSNLGSDSEVQVRPLLRVLPPPAQPLTGASWTTLAEGIQPPEPGLVYDVGEGP